MKNFADIKIETKRAMMMMAMCMCSMCMFCMTIFQNALSIFHHSIVFIVNEV